MPQMPQARKGHKREGHESADKRAASRLSRGDPMPSAVLPHTDHRSCASSSPAFPCPRGWQHFPACGVCRSRIPAGSTFGLRRLCQRYLPPHPDLAGAHHGRAQPATPFEEGLRPGRERLVHPVTWTAFFPADHADAIQTKLPADQVIQPYPPSNHVTAQDTRSAVVYAKAVTQVVKYLGFKQSYLPFIIRFITKKAISNDAALRDAFDARQRMKRVPVWKFSVMTEKVVSGRNEKVHDFTEDGCHQRM